MERQEIAKVLADGQIGDTVKVAGWIKTLRETKNVSFLHLNDGSCFDSIQVILDPALANYAAIVKLLTGASLYIHGTLQESPAKGQSIEIIPESIEVLGECDSSSPIQKSRASFEFLRTQAHMRARTNTFGAVFRTRSQLAFAVHQFFHERNFVLAHTPILTTSDCEGAGEVFQVTTLDLKDMPKQDDGEIEFRKDFFKEACGLTVSGQLEAEVLASSLAKVYTFGPTFRAENANTSRHASEFWMIEPEMAFADLSTLLRLAEDFVKHLISHMFSHCERDLNFFDQHIEKGLKKKLKSVLESDFAVVEYTKAIQIIEKRHKKKPFELEVKWGDDLKTEHERYLAENWAKRPVFVINYPKVLKPFYMYCNEDGKTVGAFDLLVPRVGELIGGSQREHRFDTLIERMNEKDMNVSSYQWYTDLRRYGSVPHAGFGLGFERAIMYLTGMENIRDVIIAPRTPGNAQLVSEKSDS